MKLNEEEAKAQFKAIFGGLGMAIRMAHGNSHLSNHFINQPQGKALFFG